MFDWSGRRDWMFYPSFLEGGPIGCGVGFKQWPRNGAKLDEHETSGRARVCRSGIEAEIAFSAELN